MNTLPNKPRGSDMDGARSLRLPSCDLLRVYERALGQPRTLPSDAQRGRDGPKIGVGRYHRRHTPEVGDCCPRSASRHGEALKDRGASIASRGFLKLTASMGSSQSPAHSSGCTSTSPTCTPESPLVKKNQSPRFAQNSPFAPTAPMASRTSEAVARRAVAEAESSPTSGTVLVPNGEPKDRLGQGTSSARPCLRNSGCLTARWPSQAARVLDRW